MMYEAIPKAIIGHLVNIFALGVFFYGHIENAKIVVAIFLVTMGCLFRYTAFHTYKKQVIVDKKQVKKWLRIFDVCLAFSALAMSTTSLYLIPEGVDYYLFAIFIIGGLIAGATGVLASFPRSFLIFSIPCYSFLMLFIFSHDHHGQITMSFMLTFFFAMNIMTSSRFTHQINRVILLSIENQQLAEKIQIEKEKLSGSRAEIESLQNQLLTEARKAGVADAAKEVLHHVGNSLNSIFTAISVLSEKLNFPAVANLALIKRAIEKIQAGGAKTDSLAKVSDVLNDVKTELEDDRQQCHQTLHRIQMGFEEIRLFVNEKNKLVENVQPLIAISVQEEVRGIVDKLRERFMDDMVKVTIEEAMIDKALADPVKLREALRTIFLFFIAELQNLPKKDISVTFAEVSNEKQIIICSEELGFRQEYLTSIFSQGYKSDNDHTAQMHHIANLLREMKGRVEAYSAGQGEGTRFIISLSNQRHR